MAESEIKYLKSLSKQFPTIAAASTEIINLQAILSLPKSTEHFITDIHGEYEQFQHVIKNGSGSIKRKIEEEFGGTFSEKEKKSLATLIYYPEDKLQLIKKEEDNLEDWYAVTIHRLVQVIRRSASKYSHSRVRKQMPADFVYIMQELLYDRPEALNRDAYYNQIISSVIEIGRADAILFKDL